MMLIAFCIAELKKSKISRSFKFSYSCWDEIEVADAHPPGARSFGQDDYIRKFRELSGLCADSAEQGPMSRFSWQPMMFLNGPPAGRGGRARPRRQCLYRNRDERYVLKPLSIRTASRVYSGCCAAPSITRALGSSRKMRRRAQDRIRCIVWSTPILSCDRLRWVSSSELARK
jgi:hypothetical protein